MTLPFQRRIVLAACTLLCQSSSLATDDATVDAESVDRLLSVYEWRNIGPDNGGRSIAVAGHPDRPHVYLLGATGGGLWKTTDGGGTWRPVTDGEIGSSSVGSIAIAPGDADVVYLGMGESQLRSNVMQGDGVYRSDDAGETWRHIGFRESRVVSAIRIHPEDADIAYVAVLGDPYVPSEERGIFRSTDGGRSWENVLFRSPRAGAVDLAMSAADPQVLYATFWEVYRKPWTLWSGGDESAVYKSIDGGDSWTDITANEGLPGGPLGKMGVAVSRADPARVWLNVEAEAGGLYRSDDAGESWTLVNGDRDLWQRSFYFMRVRAHPEDRDTVYVLNFGLQKSTDGGTTFREVPTRHVDIHELWIDPGNPERMIVADDGGGSVSVNGGETWTEQDMPTAQMYRVSTTNDFPYHVCGSQQDADSICVPSRRLSEEPGIDVFTTYYVGGGENSYVAPHPEKPGLFFAGATNALNRYDRDTQQLSDVHPWPYMVMGQAANTMTERWNWVFPIVFSPVPPHALYTGSQHLWRSDDQGRSWWKLSPDLTRAAPETLGESGGPIVLDQDGPEIYGTLHTIAPSPHDAEVVWTGSDDGLIHMTGDGGDTWSDVTPPDMPAFTRISLIDASPHVRGAARVAGNRYDLGDRRPYVWKTGDYGESWARIDTGLPAGDFVHAVREDTKLPGILYAGTEHGVHVSLDDGRTWHSLQRNLPVTRVTGLEVKGDDLVIATHGRSFYVLEGLGTLRQLARTGELSETTLFEPGTAWRREMPARIDFFLSEPARQAALEILNTDGRVIRTVFRSKPFDAGSHRVRWDLRHDGATVFEGMILEGRSPESGPWAVPGTYEIRLIIDGREHRAELELAKDPRLDTVSRSDLEEQLELALRIREATSRANETVIAIREATADIRPLLAEAAPSEATRARELLTKLRDIERALYQTRNSSPKDKIAFPIRLNNRLSGLLAAVGTGDAAPTPAHYKVFDILQNELVELLDEAGPLLRKDVPVLVRDLESASETSRPGGSS